MADWSRFLRLMLGTFAALIAIAAGLIFLANPYGNLALSPLHHVLMDDNQRFQYPAVIRSGRYDSIVIGTSTSRLLKPARLERAFGGKFANLALNSGTPWEQWRLARLFAETVPGRRTLLIGLDHVWCDAEADRNRITPRGFPEWMFDANPWNDLSHMLNIRSLEISGRRVGHALGLVRERWPHDGYEVFVPPDDKYDLERARQHIWRAPEVHRPRGPPRPPVALDGFPALAWLETLLAPASGWPSVIMLITPVHVAALPKPGTREALREENCKAEIARLALRYGRPLIDLRLRSSLTSEDANYWDGVHYRVPVADRIVDALETALRTGREDPAGVWRVLVATHRAR